MFERQFGLRENPFAAGHQSKYVYPSREHQEALAHLRFGIENREPFVLITGEVGTGKTTALYDALSEWKSRAVVALITNSALTRSELYEEICLRFGVQLAPPISKPMLMGQLERHLLVIRGRGDFGILLVDEAQNLDRGLLEEVRLLSNLETQGDKLLQIFLVGQPELEEKLMQPELRQLRQRIGVHYRLRPLSLDDTERYIHHRISVAGGHALTVFPSDACAEVFRMTHGIPREINTVAAQALLNAFVEDSPSVKPEHVLAVKRDTEFKSVLDGQVAVGAPMASDPAAAAPAAPAAPQPAASAPPVVTHAPVATPAPPKPVVAPPPPPAPPLPPAPEPPVARAEATAPRMEPPAAPDDGAPDDGVPLPPGVVRPAGSAETWQSWMNSLSQLPAKPTPPAEENFREMSWENALAEERATLEAQQAAPEPDPAEEPETIVVPVGDSIDEQPVVQAPEVQAPELPTFDDLEAPRMSAASAPPPARPAPPPEPDLETPQKFELESISMAPASPRPAPPMPEPETRLAKAASAVMRTQPLQPAAAPYSLPPRLRERLEAGDSHEKIRASRATGWLIGLAALAAVVIAVLLTVRFRALSNAPESHATPARAASTTAKPEATAPTPNSSPSAETPAATRPGSAPATSAPLAAAAGEKPGASGAVEPPAGEKAGGSGAAKAAAAAAAVPVGASVASGASASGGALGSSGPATHAGPAEAGVPKTLYGVAVATFILEDKANTEKTRLSNATGLPGRVIPSKSGDFTVVLGEFAVKSNAENRAGDLIDQSLVEEARVVSFANPAYKPGVK